MIYLAPLQGFTDFIYRKVYSQQFGGIDKFFIPYISEKNGTILKKYEREIHPKNNQQKNVIPQILVKNSNETVFLAKLLKEAGYSEINLNLGCPYPMVTNRGRGAALMQKPEVIEELLEHFFEKCELKLSVKIRAGLNNPEEAEKIIPVLNRFPLTEVIYHPRIAKQLYKGEVYNPAFEFAVKELNHKLVYNGDIFSVDDFKRKKEIFPATENWMLGRGILMNVFLPAEINGLKIPEDEKIDKLKKFHRQIFDEYSKNMDNEGNVLNKMKQFWSYFSFHFPEQKRTFKLIKKSGNFARYNEAVKKAFFSLYEQI